MVNDGSLPGGLLLRTAAIELEARIKNQASIGRHRNHVFDTGSEISMARLAHGVLILKSGPLSDTVLAAGT